MTYKEKYCKDHDIKEKEQEPCPLHCPHAYAMKTCQTIIQKVIVFIQILNVTSVGTGKCQKQKSQKRN